VPRLKPDYNLKGEKKGTVQGGVSKAGQKGDNTDCENPYLRKTTGRKKNRGGSNQGDKTRVT